MLLFASLLGLSIWYFQSESKSEQDQLTPIYSLMIILWSDYSSL